MPLVIAAVAPHGFPIIPALSDDAEGGMATRDAMRELGRRFAAARPDVVVIATPHGMRVAGAITIAEVARAAGALTWQGRTVDSNVPIDGDFTDAVAASAVAAGVPVALTGFAGNRRYQSSIPLDWGVITPAWFIGHDQNLPGSGDVLAPTPERDSGPPLVVVNPSRALPREANVAFGRAVATAAAATDRRIGFIASCDWGHCHAASGPYGFHEASARIDALVVDAVRRNDVRSLIDISDDDVQASAIDGLWQLLMLDGAVEGRRAVVDLLCYEAPTYYGLLTATWLLEG